MNILISGINFTINCMFTNIIATDRSMALLQIIVCWDMAGSVSLHRAVGHSWNIHGIKLAV